MMEYVVDAAAMEPMFDEFLEWAYGSAPGSSKGHNWHHQNPIIIINPSKVGGRERVMCVVFSSYEFWWRGGSNLWRTHAPLHTQVRANPKAAPQDASYHVPDFLQKWKK